MKYTKIFFAVAVIFAQMAGVYAASGRCSKQNLTRCLDSACAINIGANPAARCQYCGTAGAGTPPTGGMSNLSVGKSSKNSISDKELKKAPSDPGKRYMWASTECLKKLTDCTSEDVSDVYDPLIEQSCKAAGVAMQMSSANDALNKKPTQSKCSASFTNCMNKKCDTGFTKCAQDTDFDRSVSECATESSGCEEYLKEIRETIAKERKQQLSGHDKAIETLAKKYQKDRETRLNEAQTSCKNNASAKKCQESVCATNMAGKCKSDDEKAMARGFCKFFEVACGALK